jgi:hypothetical protein
LYDDRSVREALGALRGPLENFGVYLALLEASSPETASKVREIGKMIINELLYLYKNKNYRAEREVRAVEAHFLGDPNLKRHCGADGVSKLFIESPALLFQTPESRVIVGPKVKNSITLMLDIRHRLGRQSWYCCTVEQSTLAYQ